MTNAAIEQTSRGIRPGQKKLMSGHIGRYEIIEELGRGNMGVVYKARDPLIDRLVAIKTIDLRNLNQDDKGEYEARFYQEAKAAGRLNHPNIITIYELGNSDDVAFIAMELIEGTELRDILANQRRQSIDEKLDIAFQVANGLAYAHEHGVVHRDIKPSNIMVLRGQHVKIADFGIARMSSSTWHTKTGSVVGTPLYMSPEQVQSHSIDSRTDIFSLGVILYQMLTGLFPFNGADANSVWHQIVNEEPQKPSSLNPEIPEMLDFIVSKCLAKNPENRYPNAKELAADLHSCCAQLQHAKKTGTNRRHYFAGHGLNYSMKISPWKLLVIIVLIALTSIVFLNWMIRINSLAHNTNYSGLIR